MGNTKKILLWSIGIVLAMLSFYYSYKGLKIVASSTETTNLSLRISHNCNRNKYILSSVDSSYSNTELSIIDATDTSNNLKDIVFRVPVNVKTQGIRIALGDCFSTIRIKSLTLAKGSDSVVWDAQMLFNHFSPEDSSSSFVLENGMVTLEPGQTYPVLVSKSGSNVLPIICYENNWKPFWYSVMLAILVLGIWHFLWWSKFTPSDMQLISGSNAKQSNVHDLTLGILFIVILLLPLLVFKQLDNQDGFNSEKRNKAGFPKLKPLTILSYTSRLNAFLNDDFGGRSMIIQGHSLLLARVFKVSPQKSKVSIGKDDWLFFLDDGVKEYSQNRHPLSEDQLKSMRKTVVEYHQWLKLKGIKFYLMFPPIPQNMYEEYLPMNLRKFNSTSKMQQFLTYLKQTTDLPIIEIDEPLRNAKKYAQLYFKEDSHWNCVGGYVAYRKMHEAISKDFAIGPPYTSKNIQFTLIDNGIGDLEAMLGVPYLGGNKEILFCAPVKGLTEITEPNKPIIKDLPEDKYKLYWKSYINNNHPDLPKAILYRDSYSAGFIRLFLPHFSKSTLIWSKELNPQEVNFVKPDLVVFEMLERFSPLLEKGSLPSITEELKQNGVEVNDAFFQRIKTRRNLPN